MNLPKEGASVTFGTIGGSEVAFVHEGGPYGYGSWTCKGCHTSNRTKVEEANEHAGKCRAK